MTMKLTSKTLAFTTKPISFKFPVANKIVADNMFKFMKKNGGIGLAANQVGLREQVFVMEVAGVRRNVFNPSIKEFSEQTAVEEEGCLSYPDRTAPVHRSTSVTVQYFNASGEIKEELLHGLAARCFQHEYDHLFGITMLWRADQYKRQQQAIVESTPSEIIE